MADKALTVCPEDRCAKKKWGRGKVTKKISAGAGLIFKGTGFYITDYRSDSYKEAAKKDSSASTPAAASSDKKAAGSEAKPAPAAKTETKTKAAKKD